MRTWATCLAMVLAALQLDSALASPEEARVALERGNVSEAVRLFTQCMPDVECLVGIAEVQFATSSGDNDYKESLKMYRQAAAAGSAKAQHQLGFMHEQGLGTPRNTTEAARWYILAAQQEYAPSQLAMARAYSIGAGVAQDYKKARQWYVLAAKQSQQEAYLGLARIYGDGTGVQRDTQLAYALASLTAAKGGVAGGQAEELLNTLSLRMNEGEVASARKFARQLVSSKKPMDLVAEYLSKRK